MVVLNRSVDSANHPNVDFCRIRSLKVAKTRNNRLLFGYHVEYAERYTTIQVVQKELMVGIHSLLYGSIV